MMVLKSDKAKIKNIKEKIPDFTNTTTTATAVNAKINEVRFKMPTTTALTAVENKYLIFVILSKKIDNNTKISETGNKITSDHDHDKYITAKEFN